MNYKVVTAKDEVEGMETESKSLNDIDLMVTDNQMPRKDGLSMVRALRAIAPDMNIIVARGRVKPEMEQDFLDLDVSGILHKPFKQEVLKDALANVFTQAQSCPDYLFDDKSTQTISRSFLAYTC